MVYKPVEVIADSSIIQLGEIKLSYMARHHTNSFTSLMSSVTPFQVEAISENIRSAWSNFPPCSWIDRVVNGSTLTR